MKKQIVLIAVILLKCIVSIDGLAQNEFNFLLEVEVEDGDLSKRTLADLTKFTAIKITAKDKDGEEHVFKGVTLSEVLKSAGAPLGAQLRGANLVKYVLNKAKDGYEVIFSLPEIDPEFTNERVLLAYEIDDKRLSVQEGPFRLVVPHDKKHARWIRQISSVKILSSKGQ